MASEFLLIGNEIERRKININSILYVKIDDYLSTFFMINNQKFICSKSLSEVVSCLPDHFFKINRAYIVNLNAILLVKRGIRTIVLTDKTELTVSTRRMKDFNVTFTGQNATLVRGYKEKGQINDTTIEILKPFSNRKPSNYHQNKFEEESPLVPINSHY